MGEDFLDVFFPLLDAAGCGDGFSIAAAVLRAVDDSCDVINLSLGMIGIHEPLNEALQYAYARGLTIIAAAGNDSTANTDLFPFPASQGYCLSVAAVDSNSVKADFSNYGSLVQLCAPGTQIYGPFTGDSYAWWDGTSFAAPFVTGLVALVLSSHDGLLPVQVESILTTSADGIDYLNPDYAGQLGAGLMAPLAAVGAAAAAKHGDVNLDGDVTPADLAHLIDYFFNQPPDSELSVSVWADCSCDGVIDPVDLSVMLDFFYATATDGCVDL